MTGTFTSYLPRGTRLLLLSSFLSAIPLGYLVVVLPLYLARIGIEPTVIGAMYTVSGGVAAVLVAVSGLFADRFGRRRFLLAGTVIPVLSYAVFAATTDVRWLFAASVFGGVGIANGAAGALTIATFDALLADHTTETTRTRVFAASGALWTLAVAIGSLSAGTPDLLMNAFGVATGDAYRVPYLAMIVVTLAAGAALIPIQDDPELHAARVAAGWWPRRSRRPIAIYSLGIGLVGFGLGIGVQLLPLWYRLRFGVTEADLGPWYAAGQLASFATVALIPYLERRLGAPNSILVLFLGAGVSLALIVAAPVFWIAGTFHVMRSFLTNLAWPFHQSALMTTTAPEERATAVGAGFSVWGLTNAVGPIVGGALLGAGIFAVPLLVGSVMYVCGGLAFGIGFRHLLARRAAAVTEVAP